MPGNHWSKEEISTAMRMHHDGKTDKEIGAKLNRPPKGVYHQIRWQTRHLRKKSPRENYEGDYL